MKGYNLVEGVCSSCDISCYTCEGLTELDCTSCNYPQNLYNGSCVSKCPSGYFSKTEVTTDGNFNSCFKCPSECSDCTSLDTCTLC